MIVYILDLKTNKPFNFMDILSSKFKMNYSEYPQIITTQQNSQIGNALAQYAICDMTGCQIKDIVFKKNRYGKPYIKNMKNVHFNISHSGNFVVCAVNKDIEVGIDIETYKPINLNIAKRLFCKDEYNYIIDTDFFLQEKKFYEIWTKKESFIKMKGMGLYIPLNSFSVLKNDVNYKKIISSEEVIGYVCSSIEQKITIKHINHFELIKNN